MDDTRWYQDKRLLRAAYEEYGSLAGAAQAIGGVHKSTLAGWWNKLGLEQLPKGEHPGGPKNREALEAVYKRVYGA